MKTPTDNVFQLIHSMTAAEKRYFKRHYSSDKSVTTELFDYLNTMKEYDEDNVKDYFSLTRTAKNLKVHKVQLSELLLKSLTSYHNKKNIPSKIRMGLEEVEILLTKQLFDTAQSKLHRIKDTCLNHEVFSYMPAILALESQINNFYDLNEDGNMDGFLQNDIDQYLSVIKNTFRLRVINSNSARFSKSTLTAEKTEFFRTFVKQEEDTSNNTNLSFEERYFKNSALANIYKVLDEDIDQQMKYHYKNIELFEAFPKMVKAHYSGYFAILYNYLNTCLHGNQLSKIPDGLKRLNEHLDKFPALNRNVLFLYYLEMQYAFRTKNYNQILEEVLPKLKNHVKKYKRDNEPLTMRCFTLVALVQQINGNSKEVLFHLRRLYLASGNHPPEFRYLFQLLELICYYESKDYKVIIHLLASIQRKLKKSPAESPAFDLIVNLFKKFVKTDEAEHAHLVATTLSEFDQLPMDKLKNLLITFHLDEWLKAVKKDQSFSEHMQPLD